MKKTLAARIRSANAALIAEGNIDAVGDYFASDYRVHLTGRAMVGGHKVVRDAVSMLRRSFPDIQVQVEILMEDDTRIAWQRTMRGTLQAAYQGFPASGLQIVWRDMVTSELHNGLIKEEWLLTDLAEQLLLSKKT